MNNKKEIGMSHDPQAPKAQAPEAQAPEANDNAKAIEAEAELTTPLQAVNGSAEAPEQPTAAKESSQKPATPDAPDPFDLDALWATAPLEATTTKILAVRASPRPPKDKFIRVRPFSMSDSGKSHECINCRSVYLFEYQFDGDLSAKTFYVMPNTEVFAELSSRELLKQAMLVQGVVRHGSIFIWELKLPAGRNESADRWAHSRLELADRAQREWIKPFADPSGGGYNFRRPCVVYDEPEWSVSFDDAIKAACKDRVITSLEHEAVKEALGL